MPSCYQTRFYTETGWLATFPCAQGLLNVEISPRIYVYNSMAGSPGRRCRVLLLNNHHRMMNIGSYSRQFLFHKAWRCVKDSFTNPFLKLNSLLLDGRFLTWLLIGWRLYRQPIWSHARKLLLGNIHHSKRRAMMLTKAYSMAMSNYIHYMLLPFNVSRHFIHFFDSIFQDAEYVCIFFNKLLT